MRSLSNRIGKLEAAQHQVPLQVKVVLADGSASATFSYHPRGGSLVVHYNPLVTTAEESVAVLTSKLPADCHVLAVPRMLTEQEWTELTARDRDTFQ